jgi:WD40 repeat protein
MTISNRRFLVLLVPLLLGGLLACTCGGVNAPRNPPPQNPQPAEPVFQPQFTIETGLMDCWNLKKTGPTHMQVSPDGKYLLTLAMSSKENVQVWDLATHQKLHAIDNDIGTMHAHIAIAPDSRTAAYVQLRPESGIVIFDLVTGERKRTILDKDGRIINSHSPWRSMHFSPDGSVIVYGGKQIAAWDTATGNVKFNWPTASESLSPFFDNGTKIANLEGGRVYIRDAAKGRVIKTLDAGKCDALALTPDQKTLIAGTNGEFKLWDLPGGGLRKEFKMEMGTYYHITPFPDLRTAAWPTNVGFIICDLQTGTEKQRVKVNEPYTTGLAVTPDGTTLFTAATDGTIKGWKLNANGMVE